MPLYKISMGDDTRLIFAKTRAVAENHFLVDTKAKLQVGTVTPIEAAIAARDGIKIEEAGKARLEDQDEILPQ